MSKPPTGIPGFTIETYRLERFYTSLKHYARNPLPQPGQVVRDDQGRQVLVLWGNGWHGQGQDEHYRWYGMVNLTTNRIDPEHREVLLNQYSKTNDQREHLLQIREVRFPIIEPISLKELHFQ